MKAGSDELNALFEELDLLVFEVGPEGALRRLGPDPRWLARTPALQDLEDEEISPFFAHFLEDARGVWDGAAAGRLASGPWREPTVEGPDIDLESIALRTAAGRRLLYVRALRERFFAGESILQQARTFSLEYEKLHKEIEKKEILLHCIVHDLKGPLASLTGALSLLATRQLDEERELEVLQIGLEQAQRQDAMLRQVLEAFRAEVAALERFETDAESAPDLARVVRGLAKSSRLAFAARSIELQVDCGEEPIPVVGDADRLERVLWNLLENARRYAPPHSTVAIGCRVEGDEALAWVEDAGPGVPEKQRERLFDRFARAADSGGMIGLGLHFCRMTVQAWGGTISHEPRRPRGARFVVRLLRPSGS